MTFFEVTVGDWKNRNAIGLTNQSWVVWWIIVLFYEFALPGHLVFKLFLLLLNLGWGRSCTAWPCYAATVNMKEWNLTLQQEQCRTVEPRGLRNLVNSLSLSSWTVHYIYQLQQHFKTINRHFRSMDSRCWIDCKDHLMKQ